MEEDAFLLEEGEGFGGDPSLHPADYGYNGEQDYPQEENYDEEGERGYSQDVYVPEVVKQFVSYLYKHIREKKIYDIQSMYEASFNKITEKHYKNSPWPAVEAVAQFANNDHLFGLLYNELTFRHIYAKLNPTMEQRFDSWKNYSELFNYLLNESNLDVELPNQWLWDMIDEFIYQFQSFCQFRSKLKGRPMEEITLLKNNPQVWNTTTVINYLQSFVSKSQIVQILEKDKQGQTNETSNGTADSSSNNALKMLGYFSLIGLLRVHCLLGDYHLALKTVAAVDVNTRGLLTKVTACHVTFFYYLGFVYMMMRRFVDAIKTFSNILLYINRIKQYNSRSQAQFDQMMKKNEQMYALLSICLVLCPQRVDENVHSYLRDKFSDKSQRLTKGDEAAFDELFIFGCPKFVSPSPPNFAQIIEDPVKNPAGNTNQDPLKLQKSLFWQEFQNESALPTIRSFLKLYTTIDTGKLSKFLEIDEKTLRTQLLAYKHKMRGLQWSGGSPLTGEMTPSSDIDFFIDQDMIHIQDSKVQRKYSEFFIRHINKFESIINDLGENKAQ